MNKYIHIYRKASDEESFESQISYEELVDFATKCALKLTPWLEPCLPSLKFELQTKGKFLTGLESLPKRNSKRKRELKQLCKTVQHKLAELKVRTDDWRSSNPPPSCYATLSKQGHEPSKVG